MNISADGATVRFKTEPEELFLAEKSGAKPNVLSLMDFDEWQLLKQHNPTKIIIQHQQELFHRTLTNIHLAGEMLNKWIVIFSWQDPPNTDHVHVMTEPDQHSPLSHSMRLDERSLPLPKSHVDFISYFLEENHASFPGPHSVPFEQGDHRVGLQQEAKPSIDERFAAITISYGTLALLQSIAHGRTMNMVIKELYEAFIYNLAKGRGAKKEERR